ncbi:MAG: AAA family ATPase [Actinomycetes bacterium]
MGLPSGTVSFLFTDVEGSTRLLAALGDGYDALLQAHREVLQRSVEDHHGVVFETEGDAVFAVFAAAGDAVAAARDAQQRLTDHPWPDGAAIRVRMAVHTGDARQVGDGYFGMSLHVIARVCSTGHGGQVLLTGATLALVPGCEVLDLGEHQLKDLSAPVRIVQLLGPGLGESFPPLRTPSVRRTNLPSSTDEFIGRAAELAEIVDAFGGHRLVTLTGAGGSGKTRMALEAASRLVPLRPDGVWLVELAPLSDGDLVPAKVAEALGLGERAGQLLEETLTEWLRTHEVLLLLDNCEHLVDDVAEFTHRLLASSPTVQILATSRELLGVPGEQALRVPPLRLLGEAEELFLSRAGAVVPGFDRDASDRDLVTQVCRRLDGLPLAIELAVARLRSLSLAELATRLDDRFRLLTGGSRTAPSRLRTLEAVVAWSYDLLEGSEGDLFRAVSVFPESFTVDAAASVFGCDVLDVIDGLGRLVEKSLVQPAEARQGRGRYQLLETLRQYGRDRLIDEGQSQLRQDGLLAWAMSWVERLERDLRTSNMDAALADVMPERDNLRAAMQWAIEREDLAAALQLVTTVPLGVTSERRSLIVDLHERGGDSLPQSVVARAYLTLADLALEQGDWAAAIAAGAAARTGFERVADRRHAAWATLDVGTGYWGAGDLDAADRLLAQSLVEFRACDDDFGIACASWSCSLREPERGIATAAAEEAERRFRELDAPMMRAHALEGRALIEIEAGDLATAAPFLREEIAILSSANNLGCTAHALETVAVWSSARGDVESAGEIVGAAEALRTISGAGHKPWEVRARHQGDYDAKVLGDPEVAHAAVDRGRSHSLPTAAALADRVLSDPIADPAVPFT